MSDVDSRWPPRIGSRVRDRHGTVYDVVAQHRNADLGHFVIVRRSFVGGWESTPLTLAAWVHEEFVVVG